MDYKKNYKWENIYAAMEENNLQLAKRCVKILRIIEVILILLVFPSYTFSTSVTFIFSSDTISSDFSNKFAVTTAKASTLYNDDKMVSKEDENNEIEENNPSKRLKVTKSFHIDNIEEYNVKFKLISELKNTGNAIIVSIKEISLKQFIYFHNFINSFYIFTDELSFESLYTIIYILDFLRVEDTLLLENLIKVLLLKLNTDLNDFKVFIKNCIIYDYRTHRRISFELCKSIFKQYISLLQIKKDKNELFYYEKNRYFFSDKYSFLFKEDKESILDLSNVFLNEYFRTIRKFRQRKIICNFIMLFFNIETIYFSYYNLFTIDKLTVFCTQFFLPVQSIIFYNFTLDSSLINFIENTFIFKKVENIYFLNYNLDGCFFNCLESLKKIEKIVFFDKLGYSGNYLDMIDGLECIRPLEHAFINNLAVGIFKPKDTNKNYFSSPIYLLKPKINSEENDISNYILEKMVYYRFFEYNYLFWKITGIISEYRSVKNLNVKLENCKILNLDFNINFILENSKGFVFIETEIDLDIFVDFLKNSKIESLRLKNIKITNPEMDIKFVTKNKSIKFLEISNPEQLYQHKIYEFVNLLENLENLHLSFDRECLNSEDVTQHQNTDIKNLEELNLSAKTLRENDIHFLKNIKTIENLILGDIKDCDFFTEIFEDTILDKIKCLNLSNCEIYKIENRSIKYASIETMRFKNCSFKNSVFSNSIPLNICQKIRVLEFEKIKITKSDMKFIALLKNLKILEFKLCYFDDDAIYNFPSGSFKNIIVINLEFRNEDNKKMIIESFEEVFSKSILNITLN